MYSVVPFAVLAWGTWAHASSLLLSGGTIIAFNTTTESLSVIREGSVLVTDGKIAGVYDHLVPQQVPDGTEFVDTTDKIISPGFIDTHRHGWQTAFKTIGSNTSLVEYFGRYGEYVAGSFFTPEDVYIGQLAGLYEAMNAGTTTLLDHASHTWSDETSKAGLQASIDSGARVFWAYSFHTVANYTISQQLANYKTLLKTVPTAGSFTKQVISYDSFSGNPSGQETKDVIALARDSNVSVLTMHALGGPWSNENSPEVLHALGILNDSIPIVLSHASFLTAVGATLLRATNQYISITPESEMHYGHGHPVSHLIQDQAALGVDTHFTYSIDMITQARIWLQKARATLYEEVLHKWQVPANNPMSVKQAFLLATRHGGLALHRNDLGIIAPGAQADLVVFDGRSPSLLGWNDPIAAVILHANVGDIDHVLVGGEFRKRDGKLTAKDYAAVQDRFLASAKRLQAVWSSLPSPPVAAGVPFFGGYPSGLTLEADTLRGPGTGY